MQIKHSKYKNTAILFEILVKQITADTLSGKDSKAVDILKKYFSNTELGKEYKLYETLTKSKNVSEGKATTIIDTILESSKKLNKNKLRKEKYNLVKEIKEDFNIDEIFNIRIKDYKVYASIYTLLEIYGSDKNVNPQQIIDNKVTLLEYLTQSLVKSDEVKNDVLQEFASADKDIRILTYRILLDRFNEKYSGLNSKQKTILKEYIESVDSTSKLKDFYNDEILNIKQIIFNFSKKVENKPIKIKLQEVLKYIRVLDKNEKATEKHLVDLLQYHNLIDELKKANG